MEKDIPCKWKPKESLLISDKIDFKKKTVIRNKDGWHIMIKGSIQQEDKIYVNIYVPIIGAYKYIKQILTVLKGETDSNTK